MYRNIIYFGYLIGFKFHKGYASEQISSFTSRNFHIVWPIYFFSGIQWIVDLIGIRINNDIRYCRIRKLMRCIIRKQRAVTNKICISIFG